MTELTDFLYTWIPVFLIMGFVLVGLLKFASIRSTYKIKTMNQEKRTQKESETFGGAIKDMIDGAPANLKQIESELMTIRGEAMRKGMSEEQLKPLVARLESERDMLKLATKYGKLVKPLAGSLGNLAEKILGGVLKTNG